MRPRWTLMFVPALLAALALAVGCPQTDDDDDTTVEECPAAETPVPQIIQPSNTASFGSGDTVDFVGHVADDADDAQDLETHWYDEQYMEAVEFDAPNPDANGEMRFTKSDFADGIHTITLEVFDSAGCRDEDKIVINVGAE